MAKDGKSRIEHLLSGIPRRAVKRGPRWQLHSAPTSAAAALDFIRLTGAHAQSERDTTCAKASTFVPSPMAR
jgi:hypothetical protein